ncbi:MAG TPA: hypothetical protein VN610_01270 [Bryobacteraceae bacterium]|nr:hypothetical protein [Bryobacteraceae bacterium]
MKSPLTIGRVIPMWSPDAGDIEDTEDIDGSFPYYRSQRYHGLKGSGNRAWRLELGQ